MYRQCVCFHNFKSVIGTNLEHFESAFVVLLAINSSGSLLQKLCREGDSVSETDLHSAWLSSLLEAFILVGRAGILQLVYFTQHFRSKINPQVRAAASRFSL